MGPPKWGFRLPHSGTLVSTATQGWEGAGLGPRLNPWKPKKGEAEWRAPQPLGQAETQVLGSVGCQLCLLALPGGTGVILSLFSQLSGPQISGPGAICEVPLLWIRGTSLPLAVLLASWRWPWWESFSLITRPDRAQARCDARPLVPAGRPSSTLGRIHPSVLEKKAITHVLSTYYMPGPRLGLQGKQRGEAGRGLSTQPHVLCVSDLPRADVSPGPQAGNGSRELAPSRSCTNSVQLHQSRPGWASPHCRPRPGPCAPDPGRWYMAAALASAWAGFRAPFYLPRQVVQGRPCLNAHLLSGTGRKAFSRDPEGVSVSSSPCHLPRSSFCPKSMHGPACLRPLSCLIHHLQEVPLESQGKDGQKKEGMWPAGG